MKIIEAMAGEHIMWVIPRAIAEAPCILRFNYIDTPVLPSDSAEAICLEHNQQAEVNYQAWMRKRGHSF